MNFVILITVFMILIFVPFIPGILELLFPIDDKAMSVRMDYSKDPSYFGNSFRRIMVSSISKGEFKERQNQIKLSSVPESILVIHGDFNSGGENFESILVVFGDLISKYNNSFNKEIYVKGNAFFGGGGVIRAAAVDKNAELKEQTKIIRWLDVKGCITVGEESHLGVSVSCGEKLQLSKGCRFRRLFGNPILTPVNARSINYGSLKNGKNIGEPSIISYSDKIINGNIKYEEPVIIKGNLIINGNLEIKNEFTINGDIKANGKVIIDTAENVTINGNVVSESVISMKGNIKAVGDIFSQDEVYLEGINIGSFNNFKSVIAKKKLTLGKSVEIYGFVSTEGIGIVEGEQ